MSELNPTPTTRTALHTIAAHVLARRRYAVGGRFGLRAGPGGIATPAFGDDPETIRISGVTLVREVGGLSTRVSINGSTLRALAGFVDVDLDAPFSCGDDTPPLGAVDVPFDLVVETATEINDWFALAWTVLDDILGSLPTGIRGRHHPVVARALRRRDNGHRAVGAGGQPGFLTRRRIRERALPLRGPLGR